MSNTDNKGERRTLAARGRRLFEKLKGGSRSKSEELVKLEDHQPAEPYSFPPTSMHSTSSRREKRNLSNRHLEHSSSLVDSKIQRVDVTTARKPGIVPRMWTSEQDAALRAAVGKYGEKKWREIAKEVPGRNPLQCHQRWKKAICPGLKKGTWSREEDEQLLQLVKTTQDWTLIATHIPGRNAKQCRERWFLNLDPSIKREPWNAQEDQLLLELEAEYGGRWSLIAKHIPGRTENNVKTRFHSLQRVKARARGWQPDEDQVLVDACLRIGREFQQITKLLPGRTKSMLKKRFALLVQQDPSILTQVEMVEAQLKIQREKTGSKPMVVNGTIHAPPVNLNPSPAPLYNGHQQQQNPPRMVAQPTKLEDGPSSNNGNQRRSRLTKNHSSWLEEVVENITVPMQPNGMVRTDSTSVLFDALADPNDIGDTMIIDENEPSPFSPPVPPRKQLGTKSTSLAVLERVLSTDLDFDDIQPLNMSENGNWASSNRSLGSKRSSGNMNMTMLDPELFHHRSADSTDGRLQRSGSSKLLLGDIDWGLGLSGSNRSVSSDPLRGMMDMRSFSEVLNTSV